MSAGHKYQEVLEESEMLALNGFTKSMTEIRVKVKKFHVCLWYAKRPYEILESCH